MSKWLKWVSETFRACEVGIWRETGVVKRLRVWWIEMPIRRPRYDKWSFVNIQIFIVGTGKGMYEGPVSNKATCKLGVCFSEKKKNNWKWLGKDRRIRYSWSYRTTSWFLTIKTKNLCLLSFQKNSSCLHFYLKVRDEEFIRKIHFHHSSEKFIMPTFLFKGS